jgi:hypothetical protein
VSERAIDRAHQLEVVVDSIAQGILERVDTLYKYWHVGERPAFTRKLTDQEIAERLMNDPVRLEIMNQMAATQGPDAVAKWLDEAMAAYDRAVSKAAGG